MAAVRNTHCELIDLPRWGGGAAASMRAARRNAAGPIQVTLPSPATGKWRFCAISIFRFGTTEM